MFLTKKTVAAVKWLHNKAVTLLTAAHNLSIMTAVNRTKRGGTKEEVHCAKAVAICNDVMAGVDRFDQKVEKYHGKKICKMMASYLLFSF